MGSITRPSLIVAMLILAICCHTAPAALSDFETGIYWSTGGYDLYYGFYDPFKNTTPPAGELYPLLIYLHGSGNAGRDISGPATHPNASLLVNTAKTASTRAFMIVPQSHSSWSATDGAILALREMIAEYATQHPIDLDRVYMTGFSLGGLGIFSFSSAYPNEIAAGGPMAGALWEGDNVTKATNRGSVAMWAFSGSIDGTVPPADCEEALSAQAYYGGDPLFTIYASTGHNDTWKRVNEYDAEGLITWMYAQRNGQPQDDSMFIGWPINQVELKLLDGPGDSITRELDYFAGYYGRGDLGIFNGAVVSSRNGRIAANGGSRGNVVIDGIGSAWNCSGTLRVGANNGMATLHVSNGATVSANLAIVNEFSILSGNANFDIAELRSEGEIFPGDISTELGLGTTLTYGGRYVTPVPLSSAGDDPLVQPVLGAGIDSTGVMSVDGSLRMYAKNRLTIELGGGAAGEFDAIVATGTVYLAGELNLALVDDFKPYDGQEFVIISGSSVSGSFSDINGTVTSSGVVLTPVVESNQVKLVATLRKPGDADGNGYVTIDDFIILKANYGRTDVKWSDGDFDGDGTVEIDDFILLKQNYGT